MRQGEFSVEEMAKRRGLRTVLAIPFELARVAEGNPMVMLTTDGEELLVKIPTVAEFLEQHRKVCAVIGIEPNCTPEQAAKLVKPWPVRDLDIRNLEL